MTRPLILVTLLGLGLAGCGQSGSSEAAPAAPARPEATAAEKAILLAALPSPYNADYNYTTALKTAGFTWDADRLDHWLQNPRSFLPGNKMTFPGLADATDRRDVIAWLKVETGYVPAAPATPVP